MKESLAKIHARIERAARRVGKNAEEITLIAVSKTYPVSAIEEAIANGCNMFGENKVQELMEKIPQVQEEVQWHLIGYLQTNKVKYIVGEVELIHSVDRLKLIDEIEKQSIKKQITSNILLEVNVAKEESKHGFLLEEIPEILTYIQGLSHVKVKGLMTVAPYVENPEENREIFKVLKQLSVDIQKQNMNNIDMAILSMGMSNDYEIAIEEGANMIRIGTALFGARKYL
ncbi:MAG: YggS family pyridoxal phosphate-dependent enzyme [Cellulosilyticaceae bacterium]